jgi:excisionase family DNA binding protein
MNVEELVPIAEAAKHTQQSESSIRRGLKLRRIQGVKIGRDWLLPTDEVDRLAKEYPLVEHIPGQPLDQFRTKPEAP